MQALVQNLADEAAIKNLQQRYCRGIDRRDWDLIRSCYHPDATDDHGEFVGNVDEFIAYARASLPKFLSTSHLICNQLVSLDGSTAWAEAYVLAYHRLPADEQGVLKDWVCNARFVDRMTCRDGEWRIAQRRVIVDGDRVVPVTESWCAHFQWQGRPDRSDPSYTMEKPQD